MRAPMSSSDWNTMARPVFSNSDLVAAERLMMAPSGASDPNSATSPPSASKGSLAARMTRRSTQPPCSAAKRWPSVSPVTVMQSRSSSGASSRSTAPMPPAAWKSSM